METTTYRYALRHLPTGRFARLYAESNRGRDFCGEESCALTVKEYELDLPRFEAETLYDLLSVTARDEDWFNSSRDRPMWAGLKMDDFALMEIETVHVFDETGGDPVSVRETVRGLDLPRRYSDEAIRTEQPWKAERYVELFGAAGDVDEDTWPFVAIVKPEGGAAIEGLLFDRTDIGRGIVVATVPLPAKWPVDPGRPIDRKDPAYRLALVCSDTLRNEAGPSPYAVDLEGSGATPPKP